MTKAKVTKYVAMLVVSLAVSAATAQTPAPAAAPAQTQTPSQADLDSDIALLRADMQTQKTAIMICKSRPQCLSSSSSVDHRHSWTSAEP